MTEQKVDCILTAWHPPTGRRHLGNGFIRTLKTRETLFLAEEQIVTTGIETLTAGKSYVRCRIGPADAGYSTRRALDVEIYILEPATPVEPDGSGEQG